MTTALADRPHTGRRRNPAIDEAVREAVIDLLAERGITAFTAENVSIASGVARSSIYRRWDTVDDLLAAAVAMLGVRPEDIDFGPVAGGTLRGDVTAVVRAAVTGRKARAERAVMSAVQYRPGLARAYAAGPRLCLEEAFRVIIDRAVARGDAGTWPGIHRLRGVVALLHHNAMTTVTWTTGADIAHALDTLLGEEWAR